jgi:signal transduction histidine kinase
VRHNNPGGWIGIHTIQHADRAVLEIANTGPSVPAEQIPTLFEPFARAKERLNTSDGVGLGLSIADTIARAHNATITARARPGGGLELSVSIPTGPS